MRLSPGGPSPNRANDRRCPRPASTRALLAILARIVALLYGGGRFAELDVRRVATVLRWIAWASPRTWFSCLPFERCWPTALRGRSRGSAAARCRARARGNPGSGCLWRRRRRHGLSIGWIAALVVSLAVLRPRFEQGSRSRASWLRPVRRRSPPPQPRSERFRSYRVHRWGGSRWACWYSVPPGGLQVTSPVSTSSGSRRTGASPSHQLVDGNDATDRGFSAPV